VTSSLKQQPAGRHGAALGHIFQVNQSLHLLLNAALFSKTYHQPVKNH